MNISPQSGQVIKQDSFKMPTALSNYAVYSYQDQHQSLFLEPENKLIAGINYGDSIMGRTGWRAGIVSLNPLNPLHFNLSDDTLDTRISGMRQIGNKLYVIKWVVRPIGSSGATEDYHLLELSDDSVVKVIYSQIGDGSCATCHRNSITRVHKDASTDTVLFAEVLDQWDWAGDPNSYQMDIVKLTKEGNVLWRCRPNNNDSFNTPYFRAVQTSDKHILCSWNNMYYGPHKHPTRNSNFIEANDSCTTWFAKIDYQTGKVLWRKNINEFLRANMVRNQDTSDPNRQALFIHDVHLLGEEITWIGHRVKGYLSPTNWKHHIVVLKTDSAANPTHYKEYEIYKGDTGDKGFQPISFLQLENGSILISGEYENRFGSHSGGTFLHKAAVIMMDSTGCFDGNCGLVTGTKEINASETRHCRIFPNPASEQFQVELSNLNGNEIELYLYDAIGALKKMKILNSAHGVIDVSDLNNGVYYGFLKAEKQSIYLIPKVVVIH